ncbi:MAG: flagellar hook-length control protein FliK [Bacillota bacterium]|uniref:flagellar hook-length control protein FliK n=1 Tax=Virgibacillus TaxID=84406 RepID=UPI000EF51E3A|nr:MULTISPECIES: flagellar hook-length control protein FliK [Virgibacillus]MCC2249279.1 flagellar hook-length control protein FliK [Virgibacillus sp. AGTR]MDY7043895.1 flagellar hook-length control protein FliK [Virgibacillus sp. M23]QRZ17314.1 flagellar hook-length control protein FliK [Virgibacillus sp. AGTR]WBX79569.1 flagellar hook-length control protein FliK [Virgibacillus salarius]
MNAIGMLFQQLQTSNPMMKQDSQLGHTNEEAQPFQDLLLSKQQLQEAANKLLQMGMQSQENQQDTPSIPFETIDMTFFNMLSTLDGKELTDNRVVGSEQENEGHVESNEETATWMLPALLTGDIEVQQLEPSLQQQLASIFAKVEAVVSQISNKQELMKASTKLLPLLQQWTDSVKGTEKVSVEQFLASKPADSKEKIVWQQLVQAFEKRNQIAQKLPYHTDAKVTSADVAKWLDHALETFSSKKDSIAYSQVVNQANVSTLPMAKMEQHMIYLNPSQQNMNNSGQELIQQFQKIMKSSKFLTMANGSNQLQITLRPQNLGDMVVRLTQMDGQMTVKILVSSQVTKDMLESNMHQLRSMFSPQQVVVEKQEIQFQQGQQVLKDTGSEADSQQFREQDQHGNDSQESENNQNEDFATQFEELLLNEQV